MLSEMKPETVTEAALAFLHRAAFSGQNPERTDSNIALASRLM